MRLRQSEFVPHAPEELGKTVHIHHCRDEPGKDKLYITRTYDGNILAYCHHCGASGFMLEDRTAYDSHTEKLRAKSRERHEFTFPDSPECHRSLRDWSVQASVWASKGGLDENLRRIGGLFYSPAERGVVIPMWDLEKNLVGYQVRTDSGAPKYLTHMKNDKVVATWVYGDESDILYIVEDILSALAAVRRGYRALPLFGTHLTTRHIAAIIEMQTWEKIKQVMVWLDNDNPVVVRKAHKITAILDNHIQTTRIPIKLDPKEVW